MIQKLRKRFEVANVGHASTRVKKSIDNSGLVAVSLKLDLTLNHT
jgi:hypothetical protein